MRTAATSVLSRRGMLSMGSCLISLEWVGLAAVGMVANSFGSVTMNTAWSP